MRMLRLNMVNGFAGTMKALMEPAVLYFAWDWWRTGGAQRQPGHVRAGRWLLAALLVLLAVDSTPLLLARAWLPPAAPAEETAAPTPTELPAPPPVVDWSNVKEVNKASEDKEAWIAACYKLSTPWVTQALRTDSAEERAKGFRSILEAMRSSRTNVVYAGLLGASRTFEGSPDKPFLCSAVGRLVDHREAIVRGLAFDVLTRLGPQEADIAKLLAEVPGAAPEEYGGLAASLARVSGTRFELDFTGRFGPPMLSLLERGIALARKGGGRRERYDEREVLVPLDGGLFSPAIEARVLEWSHLGEQKKGVMDTSSIGFSVFRAALCGQRGGSPAVVKRLLELADYYDANNIGSMALWALHYRTVPEGEERKRVVASVIELLRKRKEPEEWREGLGLLGAIAGKEDLPAIESLLAHQDTPVRKIIEDIKSRQP